jgi:hypothetical protein
MAQAASGLTKAKACTAERHILLNHRPPRNRTPSWFDFDKYLTAGAWDSVA